MKAMCLEDYNDYAALVIFDAEGCCAALTPATFVARPLAVRVNPVTAGSIVGREISLPASQG